MRKYLIVMCLALITLFNSVKAANVTAYLTYATFNVPAKGPYIETYLSVIGNTVKFIKNTNGKYQGAIDISITFLQNGEIKNALKYTLSSPETADTSNGFPNFIDQHRFTLSNGDYYMELTIADQNRKTEKPFKNLVPVTINFPEDRITISDVQLLESFVKTSTETVLTKNGYDLIPYVSTFFPENISKIKLYAEIYNSKKILGEEQKMLISYFLESAESKIKLNDYSAFSKQSTNDANVLLTELNIEELPSGNYNLVIEVRDKENKIQAEERFFIQRQNKQTALSFEDLKSINVANTFVSFYKSLDTLADYIRSLRPISQPTEIQYAENQLSGRKLELMQQYFYNFWKTRDTQDPQLAWLEYYKEVMKVNKEFATYGFKGYDTDRGRVYLQYGAPNSRNKVDTEPSALPYEIWQYDALIDKSKSSTNPNRKQSNKKFVFYNPDLVTNRFPLIHSTAIGEINNSRWELQIHKRNKQSSNLDDEKVPDGFGGHSDDNFRNPK